MSIFCYFKKCSSLKGLAQANSIDFFLIFLKISLIGDNIWSCAGARSPLAPLGTAPGCCVSVGFTHVLIG